MKLSEEDKDNMLSASVIKSERVTKKSCNTAGLLLKDVLILNNESL